MTGLRLAYLFNIVVLFPVLWSLYRHAGAGPLAAFQGKVANVDGLRLLVAALWLAVLLCSAAGLAWPAPFAALLVFQVVYKATYLATYVAPAWRAGGSGAVPLGIAGVFLFIVLVWPLLLWAAWDELHPSSG